MASWSRAETRAFKVDDASPVEEKGYERFQQRSFESLLWMGFPRAMLQKVGVRITPGTRLNIPDTNSFGMAILAYCVRKERNAAKIQELFSRLTDVDTNDIILPGYISDGEVLSETDAEKISSLLQRQLASHAQEQGMPEKLAAAYVDALWFNGNKWWIMARVFTNPNTHESL